jgi:hypothetical protein
MHTLVICIVAWLPSLVSSSYQLLMEDTLQQVKPAPHALRRTPPPPPTQLGLSAVSSALGQHFLQILPHLVLQMPALARGMDFARGWGWHSISEQKLWMVPQFSVLMN